MAVNVGRCFRADGSLWVVGPSGRLTKFARLSLQTSGAPEASVALTLSGRSVLWSAAFWPKPPGLPLNQRRPSARVGPATVSDA